MISIITPDTMRALENIVMDAGVSEAELIERAASGIAEYVSQVVAERPDTARSVLAVAGPGNNGVDALVAAAILKDCGWDAAAKLIGRKDLSGIEAGGERVASLKIVDEIGSVDVILDGIFGNSGRTDLPREAVEGLHAIRDASARYAPLIVAVDCPTGTNTLTGEMADDAVPADITLCISNPKIGMLRSSAVNHLGELVVLDIGVRTEEEDESVGARMIDAEGVRQRLTRRPATSHKSQIGGLLVVGGAPTYYGAPRLAGEAALRSGCGYVGLAVPRSIAGTIAGAAPELIFHPTSDADGRRSAVSVRKALADGNRYQAIVIGPGLGRDEVASDLLDELLQPTADEKRDDAPAPVFGIPRRAERDDDDEGADISTYPLVLDADALNWLSEQPDWTSHLAGKTCVLTPHVGEIARLLKIETDEVAADPWNVARRAASDWGQIVVLKGPMTCIASPGGEVFVSPRTTPELATPGTGDVLAGMIGAFIAQGHSALDASIIAIFVGAIAGRGARLQFGTRSVIARDLIARLSAVLRDLDSPSHVHLAESRS